MIKVDEDAFYTVNDVSEKLGLSINTIRNYCKAGKIPDCKKPGKSWIIPGTGLKKFLKGETKNGSGCNS